MITLWQNLWFVIIFSIVCIYSLLDGFDLGIGLLLPLYKKTDHRKKILDLIFPFWDGNELWLIIGITVLFAVSPITYSSLLSGFYPGLMFIIFAVTCRAASFEFIYMDNEKRKNLWYAVFFLSTLVISAGGMISAGNLIQGYPLNELKEFTGGIMIFFRPYTILTALLGIVIFIMHGISYILLKSDGELKSKTVKIGKFFSAVYLMACIVFLASTLLLIPEAHARLFFYIGSFLMLCSIIAIIISINFTMLKFIFLYSSAAIAGFWIMTGGVLFPNIIKASNDSSLSITIYNSSSSLATLKYLAIYTLTGMILISVYTFFIYRVFRKK